MYKCVKRLIDLVLSLFGLLILSPLLVVVILWIKLDSDGPVFFRQRRLGQQKKEFEILKFRTMRIDTPREIPTHLLENPDQWITRSGAFLRKTSLDELPQLWNVIKGEMSLVGPRPVLWNQYDLIEERDLYKAYSVRPGLTGWAQINGRDELSVEEKAKLDGYYVQHIGPILDCKCLFGTVISVLKQEGIVEGKVRDDKK